MANPEHVNWLREGVEPWNRRRRETPFDPDLSSEDISRSLGGHEREDIRQITVNLKGINLSGADLSNSTLRDTNVTTAHFLGSNLAGSKLIGTDLSGSIGVGADFRRAVLHSARLVRAQFLDSQFSAAQLVGADLEAAMFFRCTLDGAHLYSAKIVGCDFMLSRPWTARLYFPPVEDSITPVPFPPKTVERINDLLDACRDLRDAYGEHAILYFRGEGCCSWELRPSAMRATRDGVYAFRAAESEMLNDLMTRQPDAFGGVNSALAQWVFAQHHGLKTRLLDITRNPLVALFNACTDNEQEDGKVHVFAVPKSLIKPFNSDTVRIISNFAKLPRREQNLLLGKTEADARGDCFFAEAGNFLACRELFARAKARLYALIRHESPSFDAKIDWRDFFRVIIVEPQHIFDRLRAQSGAFLVSAFHERFESEEVSKRIAEVPLYGHHELRIPFERKLAIVDELRLLNVTREVLYPGVDEAASAITQQHLHRTSGS